MSRIYVVTAAVPTGHGIRFVRAESKAGAVRAVAAEMFTVNAASAEDIVAASASGTLDILDALKDDADPGPVPAEAVPALRAVS